MRCYITSIGEPTTDLCVKQLSERFEVTVLESNTTLWEKLKFIYFDADEDFVRVDADVIPNKNLSADFIRGLAREDIWWLQFLTFDWFKQDVAHGGVQYIKAECIPHLRKYVDDAMPKERPETYLSRLESLHNPRRFESHPVVMGLQNYNNDMDRVRNTKTRRDQLDLYDFDLAKAIYEV